MSSYANSQKTSIAKALGLLRWNVPCVSLAHIVCFFYRATVIRVTQSDSVSYSFHQANELLSGPQGESLGILGIGVVLGKLETNQVSCRVATKAAWIAHIWTRTVFSLSNAHKIAIKLMSFWSLASSFSSNNVIMREAYSKQHLPVFFIFRMHTKIESRVKRIQSKTKCNTHGNGNTFQFFCTACWPKIRAQEPIIVTILVKIILIHFLCILLTFIAIKLEHNRPHYGFNRTNTLES